MTPERLHQLDKVYMECARGFAKMSLATRNKVGALLVKDDNPLSSGWNGMPSGMSNQELEYTDEKGNLTTNPLVLHAEANAILKCAKLDRGEVKGATLYITLSPCVECCKLIMQAGIVRVVYENLYRVNTAIQILRDYGIIVDHLPLEE